jgi:hypothetical protein
MLESTIERACVLVAHDLKCKLIKIRAVKGFPDRMLLTPYGTVVFVEFKRPGETLQPLQEYTQSELQRMNFQSLMVTSKEQFKSCLRDLLAQPGSRMPTKTAE